MNGEDTESTGAAGRTPDETIEMLKAAIASLEAGDGPVPFFAGHGIQSRRFVFEWRDDELSIDFDLPCARVLSDEDTQSGDDAEIGAACRMAILLLAQRQAGKLLRRDEGEAHLDVSCGDYGTRYAITGADGETIDQGDDWSVLATRIEASISQDDAGGITIFWP